jgi:hypothetical protein
MTYELSLAGESFAINRVLEIGLCRLIEGTFRMNTTYVVSMFMNVIVEFSNFTDANYL